MFEFAAMRAREFSRLNGAGAYLDYTGAALYPEWLPVQHARSLAASVRGNPHADSPASRASTASVERVRSAILHFFDADPVDYDVILTANASGGMRLVAESFPFRRGSRFVLTADNHNSVNGIRIAAERCGALVEYVGLTAELLSHDPAPLLTPALSSLFAMPAQSNFSGVVHPLEHVHTARRAGYRVLLDAAAFVPTHALSLREVPADFVAISFYKMFGYPTGIGALIARHDAVAELTRGYFAGGTVAFVSVQNRMHRLRAGAESFEDGTPDFLAVDAVEAGLRWLDGIGMDRIRAHTASMTAALLERIRSLGDAIVVYGPAGATARGGTVSFNVRRDGRVVPFEDVEAECARAGVSVRGGCFCNPGAAEAAFDFPALQARQCLDGDFTPQRLRTCLDGRAVGAIRASVGIPTIEADLDLLRDILRKTAHSGPTRTARARV